MRTAQRADGARTPRQRLGNLSPANCRDAVTTIQARRRLRIVGFNCLRALRADHFILVAVVMPTIVGVAGTTGFSKHKARAASLAVCQSAAAAQCVAIEHAVNRLRMVVASFLTKDLGIDCAGGSTFLPSI